MDQTVQWEVNLSNVGRTELDNVIVLDQLPPDVTVVPGSVELISSNFPNGSVYGPEAVQDNGEQVNVNVGALAPSSNVIVLLETKINNTSDLQCGNHQLVNTAYVTPQSPSTTIKDTASVTVVGSTNCTPPPPPPNSTTTTPQTPTTTSLPNTGPGNVIGIFSAVTLAGAFLHRLFTRVRA
jgi:uncharacterized repeat protein (TIGR01451 family)